MRDMYVLSIIFACFAGGYCLKDVRLEMDPANVPKGEETTLHCFYDLEKDGLQSVKWYRGTHEFYRYSPSETPNNKVFPYAGINVDISRSDSTKVTLTNIGFQLDGPVSCEVTLEKKFRASIATGNLTVLALPDKAPVIHTHKSKYKPNEAFIANCTSAPSKPPAILNFFVNGYKVSDGNDLKFLPEDAYIQRSVLTVNFTLGTYHFLKGRLLLNCTASVSSFYTNSTEMQIPPKPTEPHPARVTLNGANSEMKDVTAILSLIAVVSRIFIQITIY